MNIFNLNSQVNIDETPRTGADDRLDSSPRLPTDSTPRALDTPLPPLPVDSPLPPLPSDTPLSPTPDILVEGKKEPHEIVTIADIQFTPTEPLSEREKSSREVKVKALFPHPCLLDKCLCFSPFCSSMALGAQFSRVRLVIRRSRVHIPVKVT